MSQPTIGREEILKVVREFVLAEFLPGEDPSALTDNTPLITGGILDSVASVKLIIHFEQQFDIRFETQEVTIEHLDTISRMVNVIENKTRENEGGDNDNRLEGA